MHYEEWVELVVKAFEVAGVAILAIGYESGTTVSSDYTAHGSRFTGKLHWVQLDVGVDDNDHYLDPEERLRVGMARQ